MALTQAEIDALMADREKTVEGGIAWVEDEDHSPSALRDKEAYVPTDITALATEPAVVWQQFCAEAGIRHLGQIGPIPPIQGNLWR